MALSFEVLGQPGRDNALFVKIDTGQAVSRLLFDCGDGCPHALPLAELLAVDHLFFSHLHMDHVAGFDLFFRANHNRDAKPNVIWGPAGTAEILHHRFRGFLWNLVADASPAGWNVIDVRPDTTREVRFQLNEGFRTPHAVGERPRSGAVLFGDGFTVEAHLMDHGTPSAAYVVRERPRVNVDTDKMKAKGFAPGPWVKRLRGPRAAAGETIEVQGEAVPLAALQDELLVTTPGDSIAYLTDFRMDDAARTYLAKHLKGVNAVVCECQYRTADRDLAERNMHMAADEVGMMAGPPGWGVWCCSTCRIGTRGRSGRSCSPRRGHTSRTRRSQTGGCDLGFGMSSGVA
jgi:ribonuclease Z